MREESVSTCKHGWASENCVKCPRCWDEARWRNEEAALRDRIRELQRTVAFFASVIKSGEGWSDECDRAWPVRLEPCVHNFHRTEHGMMPCTKCGAEPPPASARDADSGTGVEGGGK